MVRNRIPDTPCLSPKLNSYTNTNIARQVRKYLDLAGRRVLVVENSTHKDVSKEPRDRITATAKRWCSLTDGHLLVDASCLRTGRGKKYLDLSSS